MKKLFLFGISIFILTSSTTWANTVLFDGNLGTTPDAQGWFFSQNTSAQLNTQVANPGGFTRYDTTGTYTNTINYASYNRTTLATVHPAYNDLSFDRMAGYEYYIKAQVQSLDYNYLNYTAFQIMILSQDRYGMSFMFYEDSIRAFYFNGSTAVWRESSNVHNPTELTDYRISISGSEYALYVNDSTIPLINGQLAYIAYSGFASNSFYIGDGTGAGSGVVDIYEISTSLGESPVMVPEPATLILSLFGVISLYLKKTR